MMFLAQLRYEIMQSRVLLKLMDLTGTFRHRNANKPHQSCKLLSNVRRRISGDIFPTALVRFLRIGHQPSKILQSYVP